MLDDVDLNLLMRHLLSAQAYRCRAAVSEIRINTEGRAKDDGADGWSPKPEIADPWLGDVCTCWQFKAGSAGEPSKLEKEICKRIPRETLAAGGRFVLVCPCSTNGVKGEQDRLKVLRVAAATAGMPVDRIDVFGSERLANWCNLHPAAAARWAGRPDGLILFEDWLKDEEHLIAWQTNAKQSAEIIARRQDLDFAAGTVQHLHVQGPPGVGKTRFALELCRDAPWRSSVVYVRQAADLRLNELIDSAATDEGVRLIVVADEVQKDQLRPLRDSLSRSEGRVRIITIGHPKTPDPSRIPSIRIAPLERQAMVAVIRGWFPAMPPEHVDFVVRFADGYVRLGKLAAEAVMRDPTMDVRRLLDLEHIRGFLDGMLGSGDRGPLHVVAALTSVGWTEDRQTEGSAIAGHLGLDWNDVRRRVEDFDRRLGIAPRGGRYRYISPTPLGIHLAVEAWSAYPDLMKSLPDVLPSEEARDSYFERLKSIASNPQAREFARSELAGFFRLEHFVSERATRRWSALTAADPAGAARSARAALEVSSVQERLAIADRARREMVWTLVRMAWKASAFFDAAVGLALLAEAENETWGNNASAEFVQRFQLYLGGTSLPYIDRLQVLDHLVGMRRPALTRLVVKALAEIGDQHASRADAGPASDEVPEREWHPATLEDHVTSTEQALRRLSAIANTRVPELRDDLLAAATHMSMLLREAPVRPVVEGLFETVRECYPDTREPLRASIEDVVRREVKYWKELSEGDLAALRGLHRRFEDASLSGRLRQHVGSYHHEDEVDSDLTSLARDLLADSSVLAAEWPWLTSGDAPGAWGLGETLASIDAAGVLESVLPKLAGRGRDLRGLCGYVARRRAMLGDDWYDKWIAAHFSAPPVDAALLLELVWRCGVTRQLARRLTAMLRSQDIGVGLVGQLEMGRWSDALSEAELAEIVQALIDRGHTSIAADLVDNRMQSRPMESATWTPFAVSLAASGELIRDSHMGHYHWECLAKKLLPAHAKLIAGAIFREQSNRDEDAWFAEHSSAKEILFQCAGAEPNGVWEELRPRLSEPEKAGLFVLGFPAGILEMMPSQAVSDWIAECPTERASLIARVLTKDFTSPDALAVRILGRFGDDDAVAGAFFSAYTSGTWWGPASAHWAQLAEQLETVARSPTVSPKLRRWAERSAEALREMSERDRQREEEEALRGH